MRSTWPQTGARRRQRIKHWLDKEGDGGTPSSYTAAKPPSAPPMTLVGAWIWQDQLGLALRGGALGANELQISRSARAIA
jgi:hypothetical protein